MGAVMKSRKAVAVGVLGLAIAGCGQAEIVPMTPPGVAFRKTVAEGMEAEGEQRNKASIQPKDSSAGDKPTTSASTAQPPSGTAPGAK